MLSNTEFKQRSGRILEYNHKNHARIKLKGKIWPKFCVANHLPRVPFLLPSSVPLITMCTKGHISNSFCLKRNLVHFYKRGKLYTFFLNFNLLKFSLKLFNILHNSPCKNFIFLNNYILTGCWIGYMCLLNNKIGIYLFGMQCITYCHTTPFGSYREQCRFDLEHL